jgi:hypothetical protein
MWRSLFGKSAKSNHKGARAAVDVAPPPPARSPRGAAAAREDAQAITVEEAIAQLHAAKTDRPISQGMVLQTAPLWEPVSSCHTSTTSPVRLRYVY